MKLDNLISGTIQKPIRIVIYGPEGLGKSTFASQAPAPIFIGAEDGTEQLNVTRFPQPQFWTDILEAIAELTTAKHEFKTLVIDTLDWAEPLLWEHICRRDKQESVEGYGYGKGYTAALDEWRVFLSVLEKLRHARGMHLVLIAHSWIKTFKNPEGEDYDRFELKLNSKAAGLVKEWSNAVLFTNYETYSSTDSKTKRSRGVDTGARLIYTERRAAYDAKNRYGLPHSLPLRWADFEAAVKAGQPAEPAILKSEILRKAKLLGGEVERDAPASLAKAKDDAGMLAQLNSWLNSRLISAGISTEVAK